MPRREPRKCAYCGTYSAGEEFCSDACQSNYDHGCQDMAEQLDMMGWSKTPPSKTATTNPGETNAAS